MTHKPPLPGRTLVAARTLRATQTDAERTLWHHLRARPLDGLKFRRRHPVPPCVVDFYCERLKLVIELGGSLHNEEVEGTRTHALERQGLRVLRFWDNQILQETEAVLEAILDFAQGRTLSPTPSHPQVDSRRVATGRGALKQG
jgi:very-short-patch-repair endonuclease